MAIELEPGNHLGGYEVVASIGRGGMGEVYRARDLKLGRQVALKVLRAELARDEERLRRFEQEAQAASALNHPNIVHIYAVDQDEDTHYIVMELVEGRTLRALLNEGGGGGDGGIELERLLDIASQIASGLAKAHKAGIVHRDLKPENIMITADGFVKILDFGLAKLLAAPFEAHSETPTIVRQGTRHGTLLGTVEYMSPEQASGKAVDHRSDQFSLGLILYEMATGRIAFRRETAAQTLASIIESEPRALRGARPDCPRGLESVVTRCLEKNPGDRFDDTARIVDALKELVRESLTPSASPRPPPPPPPPVSSPRESGGVLGVGFDRYLKREVRGALSEVERELKEAFGSERYQLRSHGRVREYTEGRLRRKLRRNRYSGTEMIRREDDEAWTPLYENRVFREEVPLARGSAPSDYVAKRRVMELGRHAVVFTTFGVVWAVTSGEVPAWMGFWGIGLAAHTFSTLPAFWSLFGKRRKASQEEPSGRRLLPEAAELLSGSFRDEVARVRVLLDKRPDGTELLNEVDLIVERMTDLAAKARDLEEQTSEEERRRLIHAEEAAQARADKASSARDRKLFERQLDVLRQRRTAIDKALVVIERLQVRQDTTEHQLRQLRLDLSRAEASSAPVPELSSRILDIRHEVDAVEAVDEAIAEELRS